MEGNSEHMKITILPKTYLGRWSTGVAIFWILFFILSQVLADFINVSPRLDRALDITLAIILAGFGANIFVMGLISVIKSKERAVLVFVAMAFGLFALISSIVSLFGLA